MRKWEVVGKYQNSKKLDLDNLTKILLKNRKITAKEDVSDFLNPLLTKLTAANLGIDKNHLRKTTQRIKKAVEEKELIIIFGDYDVDGICGAAILWESLRDLGANVMPYLPHRTLEGYGLSEKGIGNLLVKYPETKIIITVDNGIVANHAVDIANEKGLDVIITDHHVPSSIRPNAFSIVHTTQICGAAVGWFLTKYLEEKLGNGKNLTKHLELVALATVADLMRLTHANRTLTKFGIEELRKTKRVGLLEIFKEAKISQELIDARAIGHIIAPRLNAMGRIEHAIDSLRLLCTPVKKRAEELAQKLGNTNRQRQKLTLDTVLHARKTVGKADGKKLLFISHKTYEAGIIGLVAGKLVEDFYRPSIVVSIGEEYSKASARSVSGFNIIEFIRSSENLLVDAGGHPMAAGFTVETKKLSALQETLEKNGDKILNDGLLTRKLKIDLELPLSMVSNEVFDGLQKLAPFGNGNPEPVFMAKNVVVENMELIGFDKKHLRLRCSGEGCEFDAISFGWVERGEKLSVGDKIDIAYTINENIWNGNRRLQLKIKDVRRN